MFGECKIQSPVLLLLCLLTCLSLHAQQALPTPWPQHTIDASSQGADGVKLADINRDGLLDIATGWEEGAITRVYLHPGAADVKKEWPAVTVGETPDVEDAVFADLDNDGNLDVVSCSEGKTRKIYIHLGPKMDGLDPNPWKQVTLPAADDRMQWMYAEPMQVDGRHGMDLVAGGKGDDAELGWFEAPTTPDRWEQWRWHSITPLGWLMSLIPEDMDGDGDLDLVVSDRHGNMRGCRWLENPGEGEAQRQAWTSHWIGGQGLEVMFMCLADLDGDGTEEVLVAERSEETVRIFRRKDKSGQVWDEQIIPLPSFTGRAKSVAAGDLDGDGIPDLVISTNTYGDGKYGLIWLNGKKIVSAREQDFQVISGKHDAKYDKAELLDLDGDGDLDVLICEENYGAESEGLGVVWYENGLGVR